MKLRRPWRRPAAETVEPAPAHEEPTNTSPIAAPAFQVLAYSGSGLPDEEFSAQTEALGRILSFDGDVWYAWLPLDQPERAARVLTDLFEVARVHGTTIQVQAKPAG